MKLLYQEIMGYTGGLKVEKVGARVGAFLSIDDGTVNFLGYGVRIEDEVPPDYGDGMASALHEAGATNPCLLLDNGDKVYGCECWWGSERGIRARIKDLNVVHCDIKEARKDAK